MREYSAYEKDLLVAIANQIKKNSIDNSSMDFMDVAQKVYEISLERYFQNQGILLEDKIRKFVHEILYAKVVKISQLSSNECSKDRLMEATYDLASELYSMYQSHILREKELAELSSQKHDLEEKISGIRKYQVI